MRLPLENKELRSRELRLGELASLNEMVTFSWNLDLRTVTPSTLGGNWAAARPASPPSTRPAVIMVGKLANRAATRVQLMVQEPALEEN
jgi:hypothetical protein